MALAKSNISLMLYKKRIAKKQSFFCVLILNPREKTRYKFYSKVQCEDGKKKQKIFIIQKMIKWYHFCTINTIISTLSQKSLRFATK